ncbi:MAG TPA: hypothetical protein VHF27_01695 [Acidimicrobiales bacterium]|nr:hypothetical protein [Acidimicrobiales bacterium]
MSVLSVPRIYFKGQASWNPATANNNDQWMTFDTVKAELDWGFLGSQHPPISAENAGARFPLWARTLQHYSGPDGRWYQPPAEWNYYGGNEVALHTRRTQTMVTGAQLTYGGTDRADGDPLIGSYVEIVGDPYPGTTFPTAARLVDVNPNSFWSTCLLLRSLQIGDERSPTAFLHADVAPGAYMGSQWLNLRRNLNADHQLEIAGVGGSVMQACMPKGDSLRFGRMCDRSPSLQGLAAALRRPGVKGLMVRLSAYMTRYFTAEEFADCKGKTEKYTRLVQLWDADLHSGRAPTQNPAVSSVVGTIGLWCDGELASSAGGRYLAPMARIAMSLPEGQTADAALGPAVAEVHQEEAVLSLDMGGTVPECDSSGRKVDLGPLEVVVVEGSGRATTVATLAPEDYDRARYEKRAGIVDVDLRDDDVPKIVNGTLRLVARASEAVVALEEMSVTAEAESRCVWVEEGEVVGLRVHVRQNGALPTDTVHVRLAQYLPDPPPPCPNPQSWVLASRETAVLAFLGAPDDVVTLAEPGDGSVEIRFRSLRPGFATIAFFPHRDGPPPPVPPPSRVLPMLLDQTHRVTMTSASFCSVRAMPFDNDLPRRFARQWEERPDPSAAWDFVYKNVLALYQLLYPAMLHFGGLDLGDRRAVERNINRILELTCEVEPTSTVRMPVTRDLSAGKRAVLRLYAQLVRSDWQLTALELVPGL